MITVLFAYNRPAVLERCLVSLRDNAVDELLVFCDAPAGTKEEPGCRAVREMIAGIKWTSPVVVYNHEHFGLARSILMGVEAAFSYSDEVMIVEDDLELMPGAARWMENAPKDYEEAMGSLPDFACGFVPHLNQGAEETYWTAGASFQPWLWWTNKASWQRAGVAQRPIFAERFSPAVVKAIEELNMAVISPGFPIVRNNGLDGSGTHGFLGPHGRHDFPEARPAPAIGRP